MQRAFRLMLAGAAVSVVGDLIVLPGGLHGVDAHNLAIWAASNLVDVGVWMWMAYTNRAGKSWARTLSTLLTCIYTVDSILKLTGHVPVPGGPIAGPLDGFVDVLTWLIGLAVSILLWSRQSSAYFDPPIGFTHGQAPHSVGDPAPDQPWRPQPAAPEQAPRGYGQPQFPPQNPEW